MRLNKTYNALVQRGVPSDVAERVSSSGQTLQKLRLMPDPDLLALGFPPDTVARVRSGPRPPIPESTVYQLLYESKSRCCVCRDDLPFVIHHIEPWESTHSHGGENLAVLCVYHHAEAHTKHGLSQNLTAARIREFKAKWVEEVSRDASHEVVGLTRVQGAHWDYFNLARISELADSLGISLVDGGYFRTLHRSGYVDEDGRFTPVSSWPKNTSEDTYYLAFFEGAYIVRYLGDLFERILDKARVTMLNTIWTRSQIMALVRPGTIAAVQGAFFLKQMTNKRTGRGQRALAYRRSGGIRVEFEFDSHYCTSSTSHSRWMVGRHVLTAFVTVRDIVQEPDVLTIRCTVLAVGTEFETISEGRSWDHPRDSEFDEDDEELYGL